MVLILLLLVVIGFVENIVQISNIACQVWEISGRIFVF